MESAFSAFDYFLFALSLLICAAIGAFYMAKSKLRTPGYRPPKCVRAIVDFHSKLFGRGATRSQDDVGETTSNEYFMPTNQLSLVRTVFSIFASFFSAITLLGLPAEMYLMGTQSIFISLCFVPSACMISLIFIPIYYRNGFSSVFQYIELRFESVFLRKLTASFSMAALVVWAAVCVLVPCSAFENATGIPELALIICTGVITIFYSATGGIKAVVLVDTIQAFIMLLGMVIVLIVGAETVGGFPQAWKVAGESGRLDIYDWRIDPRLTHSFWSLVIGRTFYMTASVNNQALFQRCCAQPTLTKAILSMMLVVPLVVSTVLLLWMSTLVAYAYFADVVQCDPFYSGEIQKENQLMPYYVSITLNYPGFMGIYFASLFSGALSSMSTCYNTISSMIWEDWLKGWLEPKLTGHQVAIGLKLLSTAIGVITVLLSLIFRQIGGTAFKTISSLDCFSGIVLAVFHVAALFPFVNTLSLIIAIFVGTPFVFWVVVSQSILKLNSYPWLPINATDCPKVSNDSLYESNANHDITEPTPLDDFYPAGLTNTLLSLSYNYFALFSNIVIIGIAIVLSLVTRILSAFFPGVGCLRKPLQVNKNYTAYWWIKPRSAKRNVAIRNRKSGTTASDREHRSDDDLGRPLNAETEAGEANDETKCQPPMDTPV